MKKICLFLLIASANSFANPVSKSYVESLRENCRASQSCSIKYYNVAKNQGSGITQYIIRENGYNDRYVLESRNGFAFISLDPNGYARYSQSRQTQISR